MYKCNTCLSKLFNKYLLEVYIGDFQDFYFTDHLIEKDFLYVMLRKNIIQQILATLILSR